MRGGIEDLKVCERGVVAVESSFSAVTKKATEMKAT
jgi:hypothetical protein